MKKKCVTFLIIITMVLYLMPTAAFAYEVSSIEPYAGYWVGTDGDGNKATLNLTDTFFSQEISGALRWEIGDEPLLLKIWVEDDSESPYVYCDRTFDSCDLGMTVFHNVDLTDSDLVDTTFTLKISGIDDEEEPFNTTFTLTKVYDIDDSFMNSDKKLETQDFTATKGVDGSWTITIPEEDNLDEGERWACIAFPKNLKVADVLLTGFGAGGEIPELNCALEDDMKMNSAALSKMFFSTMIGYLQYENEAKFANNTSGVEGYFSQAELVGGQFEIGTEKSFNFNFDEGLGSVFVAKLADGEIIDVVGHTDILYSVGGAFVNPDSDEIITNQICLPEDDEDVAEVTFSDSSTQTYDNFMDAIEDAKADYGSTVKLIKTVSLVYDETILVGWVGGEPEYYDRWNGGGPTELPESITIDLNGNLLISDGDNDWFAYVASDSNLTIKDTSEQKNGAILGSESGVLVSDGTFNLEGGMLLGYNNSAVYVTTYLGQHGIFNMTGGVIAGLMNMDMDMGSTIFVDNGSIFNMEGGLITGNFVMGMYAAGVTFGYDATVNLSGNAAIVGNSGLLSMGTGVCMTGDGAVLNMSENARISSNCSAILAGGIGAIEGTTFNMNGGTVCDNVGLSGAGIFVDDGSVFNMNAGTITGNRAISVEELGLLSNLIGLDYILAAFPGGVGGGASIGEYGRFYANGGTISGNTASNHGGGVYIPKSGVLSDPYLTCLAAGTEIITNEWGNRKPVEELSTGDYVLAFDHEEGDTEVTPLYFVYKFPEPQTGAFKLEFDSGCEVTVVGGHAFFEHETGKYEVITADTANDFIGKSFFNLDCNFGDGGWDELVNVTPIEEAVDTYIVVSEGDMNVFANGLLSNVDGIYTAISNAFDMDPETLTIDPTQKALDIGTYGLREYTKENFPHTTKKSYDAQHLEYLNVAVGKGLLTEEDIEAAASMSMRYNRTILGGTFKLTGNTSGVEGSKVADNLFMWTDSPKITIGEPSTMSVGVTLMENSDPNEYADGGFTVNGTADDIKYFSADNEAQKVIFVNEVSADEYISPNHLELASIMNYKVTVDSGENGVVYASTQDAMEGETVTFEAVPDNGYKLTSLKWYTDDPESATDITSGLSLVMPATATNVVATFGLASEPQASAPTYDMEKYREIMAEAERLQAEIDAQRAANEAKEAETHLTVEEVQKLAAETTVVVRTENQARGIRAYVVENENLEKMKAAGYTLTYDFYRAEGTTVPTNDQYELTKVHDKSEGWYLNTAAQAGKRYYYKVIIKIYDEEGNHVADIALEENKYGYRTRR